MITPIIVVFVLLAILHVSLVYTVLPKVYATSNFGLIYLLMMPMTLVAIYLIYKRYLKNTKSVGKSFFAYVILKMILVIAFLSPWLFFKDEYTRPFVYQFLLIFFPSLFLETLILVRMLDGKYDTSGQDFKG